MPTYRAIKENANGEQGKHKRTLYYHRDLDVGGVYQNLMQGFKGFYRVLEF